ncbi:MAG: PAS-domain containing protein [Sneathiella sp.]
MALNRLKSSIYEASIAKKFFIYLMLFSIFPLLIIGFTSYQLFTTAVTKQAMHFAQETVDHQRDILDLRLEQIENLVSDITGVDAITSAVGKNTQSISIYNKLATEARIGNILNGYLSLEGLLSIDIYTLGDKHYHVGETLLKQGVNEEIKVRLFNETRASEKFLHWAGIEDNINASSLETKVLIATSLITDVNMDTLEQEPIALIAASYRIKNFNQTLLNKSTENGAYFIVIDSKNRLIQHPDVTLIGKPASTNLLQKINFADQTEQQQSIAEGVVVNTARFDRNGWRIIRFVPLNTLTKAAEDIGTYTLLVLAFCLVIVSFTAYRYSQTVVVPIRLVTNAFKAFEKGTIAPEIPITTSNDDEISELTRWYNKFLGVIRQQQEVQTALAISETRFKDFADASSDWLWETDADHTMVFVSSRFFDTIDIDRDAIIGRRRYRLSVSYDHQSEDISWEEHLQDLNSHKAFRISYPIRDRNGKTFIVKSFGKPFYDEHGEFLGYRGTATDITKEVEAEKTLLKLNKTLEQRVLERTAAFQASKERAEQLVATIDALAESVAVYDSDDRVIFYNKEYAELYKEIPEIVTLGITFEEQLKTILKYKLFTDAIGREEEWFKHRMEKHHNPKGNFEQARKDGRWLLVHEQRLADGGYAILSADITDRKLLEEQVRRAQKMEAVGQLTGGIAHDFNNILGIIQGNLELLLEATQDEVSLHYIKNAQKGIDRGGDITRKLLGFSRKDAGKIVTVSVNASLVNLKALIARSLTAYINVETNLYEDLWPISIDTGDFEDAILNLSLNARDAMPDGGSLIIETQNKYLDDDELKHHGGGHSGEFAMVSVSDTGIGMDEGTKERVFEPFYTTKEHGKGTGLGLSMVYGFVQRSGGHLNIYSELGKGTTIRMFFPRTKNEISEEKVQNRQISDLPKGVETILVVDDEQGLRDIATRHLESLGYTIVTAENGEKALNIVEERHDIDLVFSDVVMPGDLDGYQLAAQANIRRPNLKFLLTSGFTRTAQKSLDTESEFITNLNKNVLSKPYNKSELAKALRNTLDITVDLSSYQK